jgi:hypothetical protein
MALSSPASVTLTVEKFFKELISFCDDRINILVNEFVASPRIVDNGSSTVSCDFDVSLNALTEGKLSDLKRQLGNCVDSDLLTALR